jgi:FdhD protein
MPAHGKDTPSEESVAAVPIHQVVGSTPSMRLDTLAVEEPLQVRIGYYDADGKHLHSGISITMRTPGHDAELAVGFLFTEGVIASRDQVEDVRVCGSGHSVRVELARGTPVDLDRLERHFFTSSSCGMCGKTALGSVRVEPANRPAPGFPIVDPMVIHRLPDMLRQGQVVFDRTGALHASALFDAGGHLLRVREDVGRHNALDKLIGAELLAGRVPLTDSILLVSGRLSFELVQKAAVAGIPVIAAVGAPSSLAVELAQEHGLTVMGFVRGGRFNVYCGPERLLLNPVERRQALHLVPS